MKILCAILTVTLIWADYRHGSDLIRWHMVASGAVENADKAIKMAEEAHVRERVLKLYIDRKEGRL